MIQVCRVLYIFNVLLNGRSKLLNLCPIPIALCCNKNMFKLMDKKAIVPIMLADCLPDVFRVCPSYKTK